MSFLKAVATVSGITLASRAFGFVRDVMAASIMGAGPIADAFFVALRLPNFFRRMTAEGAFSVSFVPLFTKSLQQDGLDEARQFANQTMAMMLAILIPFSLLAMLFMPQVLRVLAPGFSMADGRFDMAVTLTRITFGYLLFMSLTAMAGGMLNALDKFAAFATAPVLFNVMQILFLLIASRFPTPGHAMAWAVFVSGILQFIWMLWCLRRNNIKLQFVRPKLTPKIRRLFQLMGPGMIGASAVQINVLVDTIIATMLPTGAVSYLYYADRLNQLPLGLIGTAVGTALLPKLAQRIASGAHDSANNLFNRALEWTFMLALPAATALACISVPIIRTLFERGEFDVSASMPTARALTAYALGLPAFVTVKVLSTVLYAREDTKTPVRITMTCALLNIILCLILIWPLFHAGIALATSIAGWIQAVMLYRVIQRHEDIHFDAALRRNLAKIVGCCAAMIVVLLGGEYLLQNWLDQSGIKRLAALVVLMACGGGVYGVGLFASRVLQWQNLKASFKGEGI